MTDARAACFNAGTFKIDLIKYDGYRRDMTTRLHFIPPAPRIVEATYIISYFEEKWEQLFIAPLMKERKEGERVRLTAAQHPLSAAARQVMTTTLQTLDGKIMSVRQLEERLKADFAKSEVYATLNRLKAVNEYPPGFFIYQGHLQDIVLRCFAKMEDVTKDPKSLKKGWLTRFAVRC